MSPVARVALVLVSSLLGCGRCGEAPLPASTTSPTASVAPSSVASAESANDASLGFVERTTAGASASDALPMIVAIHGMGDRPESFLPPWDELRVKARVIAPRAPRKYWDGFSWFTYPPKSEESASREIREAADHLAAALGEWKRLRPTTGKPIVTGFSQGGFLSFAIAVHHPTELAAAFPLSGGLPRPLVPVASDVADAASLPPIFAMHGDADRIVPIAMAREPVGRLRALGWRVELDEYPNVEHTVNAAMWRKLRQRIEDLLK